MTAPFVLLSDVGVEWTGMEGNPAQPPGAAKISVPYSTASQYIGVGVSWSVGVDLTDKIISAKVKISSGFGAPLDLMTNPGGAKLYVKSGANYIYSCGTYTNLTMIGSWTQIQFNLSEPAFVAMSEVDTFNPKDVRELGIQFDTSGTTTTARPAVILVDSVNF